MKINVKGAIVSNNDKPIYDLFDMEATSPNVIAEALENANGEDLEVIINSGGGDLFSGSEIYSILRDYEGKVEAKIIGVAASAASIIAMGADVVKMSPTASLMIHNVSLVTGGDHKAMQHASDTLKTLNKTVANAYMQKTGLTQDELLNLMENETWIEANDAKEQGFIDEILFQDEKVKAVASYGKTIPQQVIESVRNSLIEEKLKNEETEQERDGIFTAKEVNEIRSIVKEEIKKVTEKTEDKQENKTNKFKRRWSD